MTITDSVLSGNVAAGDGDATQFAVGGRGESGGGTTTVFSQTLATVNVTGGQ